MRALTRPTVGRESGAISRYQLPALRMKDYDSDPAFVKFRSRSPPSNCRPTLSPLDFAAVLFSLWWRSGELWQLLIAR